MDRNQPHVHTIQNCELVCTLRTTSNLFVCTSQRFLRDLSGLESQQSKMPLVTQEVFPWLETKRRQGTQDVTTALVPRHRVKVEKPFKGTEKAHQCELAAKASGPKRKKGSNGSMGVTGGSGLSTMELS
eukprot:6276363-Amphidinium_carterae.1